MKEAEMNQIAALMAEALENVNNPVALEKVRERVRELTRKFPLPY
jgi:glycine/serine hydroxymethyltransferase